MAPARHLMVVAGEASGDTLGAALLAGLRAELGDDVRLSGVGGAAMAAHGHVSLFPLSELAVMGLVEVLPRIVPLRRRLLQTVEFARAERPDAVITIDSPGFSLRLAERLAGTGIPRIHYVAPQVWAWRPGRVHRIARVVDHLLCLFPFEPALFQAAGLDATWVGHPAAEAGLDAGDGTAFRARHGIAPAAQVLLMLPGSRLGEIRRHLPLFRAGIERLPPLTVVVPAVPTVADAVRRALADWPVPTVIVDAPEKADAFAAGDVALAASGTVTLELALAGVPTVISYRMNPLTAWIVRWLVQVRYAGLANILADREVMPEFLQWHATPAALSDALGRLLADPTARTAQHAAIAEIRPKIAPPGPPPGVQAARAVLRILENREKQQQRS
jgi:lipid-A-disaccharide synthase